MNIYNFIKIYGITKSFYQRIIEIMRDLSEYDEMVIEDLAEFLLVLSETMIFIEDLVESVDSKTEVITDSVILKEFHSLLKTAAELEVKLENYVPIYLN